MHEKSIEEFITDIAILVANWGAMEHERGIADGYDDCNEIYEFDLEAVKRQVDEQLPAMKAYMQEVFNDACRNYPGLAKEKAAGKSSGASLFTRYRRISTTFFHQLLQQEDERLDGISPLEGHKS